MSASHISCWQKILGVAYIDLSGAESFNFVDTAMTGIPYSRLSPLAITSATAGIISSLGLLIPPLGLISIIGIISGYLALATIRRYETSGEGFARLGLVTSCAFAVATLLWTPLWQFVAYHLEAPSGYLRLDFQSLAKSNLEPLEEFVGEDICLKGYAIIPNSKDQNSINQLPTFVLSPDGSSNRLKSDIIVELPPGQFWKWDDHAISVSGTLVRIARTKENGWSKYILKSSTVRWSHTRSLLANRISRRGC